MMSLSSTTTSTFILLITISIFIPQASSIELKCVFRTSAWWPGPSFYECEDTESSIETQADAAVTDVHGTHMTGKTHDDVKSFYAYRKTMKIFPKNLEKIFKNLELIGIVNEKLQQIRQFELKPFYKLRVLYLDSNLIETLDRDLFKFNPNIEAINFSNNRIRYVDVSVFKHLVNLKSLWFENNACHSNKVTTNPTGVSKIVDEIRERCFVDNILTNLQSFQETELANLKMEISAIRQENNMLKTQIENLKLENVKILSEKSQTMSQLVKCDADMRQARDELRICNNELTNLTRRVLGPLVTPKHE